jgi:hypothetical protein
MSSAERTFGKATLLRVGKRAMFLDIGTVLEDERSISLNWSLPPAELCKKAEETTILAFQVKHVHEQRRMLVDVKTTFLRKEQPHLPDGIFLASGYDRGS